MSALAKVKKNGFNRMKLRENIAGWLFCAPVIIGLLLFALVPIILSLYSTTLRWSGFGSIFEASSVGINNYRNVFFGLYSFHFWRAMRNTIIMLLYVPVSMIIGLLIAMMVNRKMRGVQTFRVIYYLPGITSVVAISIIFENLFNSPDGVFNIILMSNFGLSRPVRWLTDDAPVIISIGILVVWRGLGYSMLMYLAGLQSVSAELVEASRIDGANAFQVLHKIILPALYPITFFLLVTGVMGGLQIFNEPFLLAGYGDNFNAMTSVSFVLFFFQGTVRDLGVAAVGAWALTILIFIVTAFQLFIDNRKDKAY